MKILKCLFAFVGLLLLSNSGNGQTQEAKDSLITEICHTLQLKSDIPDTVKVYQAYIKHLDPFLERYPEGRRQEIADAIYYRMQTTCGVFRKILDTVEQPDSLFETFITRPTMFQDKKTCRELMSQIHYQYLERGGDTTNLTVEKGIWTDHFTDGTFSKLSLHWITDCEFEIEFIESNNGVRKNLSKKGDRYKYYILEKNVGFFYLAMDIPKTDKIVKFKLFFNHSKMKK